MGLLSIRTLTLLLCLCLVFISGGLVGYLSISTEERAISDTKALYEGGLERTSQTREEGLSSCFAAGNENAENLATNLMAKALDEISTRITAYLDTPLGMVRSLLHFLSLVPPCLKANGTYVAAQCPYWNGWLQNTLQPLMYSSFRDAAKQGVTEFLHFRGPNDNTTTVLYLLSPITGDDRIKEDLGIPQDYEQLLVVMSQETGCREEWSKARCLSHDIKPPGLTQAAWDAGGHEKVGKGCQWCVRNPTDPSRTPPLPIYQTAGYCETGNGCYSGYKPDPTLGKWNPRDTLTVALPDEYGRERPGPCQNDDAIVESARNRGRGGLQCPIPNVLASYDTVILRTQHIKHHLPNKDVLWGQPTSKGPLLGLQVYAAWDHPDAWDFNDGSGTSQGFVSAAVDVVSISSLMRDLVKRLSEGTVLYAVQQNPYMLPGPPTYYTCVDDPHGLAALAGTPCTLLHVLFRGNCDADLSVLHELLPRFTFLRDHCPVSCGTCPTDEGQGWLLATSHGLAYSELPVNVSSFGRQGVQDRYALNVRSAPDPVVRSHGRHVFGLNNSLGYAYRSLNTSERQDWWYYPNQSAANLTYVDRVVEVPAEEGDPVYFWSRAKLLADPHGMFMHIILLIPRDSAMRTIDRATEQTRKDAESAADRVKASIAKETAEVDSDKEAAFRLMLIIVACACLVLIATAVLLVLSMTRPILLLGEDMAQVALMHLENVDLLKAPSRLSEVGYMQRSFCRMVANLIEYRNYMPQSILCGDGDDEDGGMPDPDPAPADHLAKYAVRSQSGSDERRSSAASQDSVQKRPSGASAATSSAHGVDSRAAARNRFGGGAGEGLKKKGLSLVLVNLRGFLEVMHRDQITAIEYHTAVIQALLNVLGPSSKGVTEPFSGDRLAASWNTVKPCATHRTLAAEHAMRLGVQLNALAATRRGCHTGEAAGVAAASGDARCGHVGCAGMKKFSMMSSVITWLYALERLGKHLGIGLLVDQWLYADSGSTHLYRIVEVAAFRKRHSAPLTVYELMGKKAVHEDEWMYQMEQGEKGDPYSPWNALATAVIKQKADVGDLLAAAKAVHPDLLPPPHISERFFAAAAAQAAGEGSITPLPVLFH